MGLVHTKRKKSLVALVAAMMGGLLALPVFMASPVAAQARSTDPACANVPEKTWTDEAQHGGANSELENAIDCVAAYGVAQGKADGSYAPNERNSREQMASFLARKLRLVTGFTMPAGSNRFAGEPISAVHRPNVEAIAATNPAITVGYSDGRFRALREVTREEMATFIVRQLRVAGANVPAASGAQFPDVDPNSPHADNIRILRQMGIVQGRADGTYGPKDIVNRGNMAIFLSRDLAELVAQGKIPALGSGASKASVTDRPELIRADIGTTVTAAQATPGNPAGTRVTYHFDEPVVVQAINRFHAHSANNTRFTADATAGFPQLSADNQSVTVVFSTTTGGINPTTAAGAAQLSVATVQFDAVRDAQGLQNPEADAPVGSVTATPPTARQTAAPDLQSVGGFRQASADFPAVGGSPNRTAVDFTFDVAANRAPGAVFNTPGGYHLVLVTAPGSALITCTGPTGTAGEGTGGGGTTIPGGNGTTTHTVICPNPGNRTTPITAGEIARGYVDAGTVQTVAATPVTNPLQAAEVPPIVRTDAPDLTGVALIPGTGANPDTVRYDFDQAIATAGPAGNYRAYTTAGGPGVAGTGGPTVSGSSVAVTFPQGTLTNAVGANVLGGTVQGSTGPVNQADEKGAVGPGAGTQDRGRTSGPNLTTVAIAQFPPFNNFGAVYVFDETVTLDPTAFPGGGSGAGLGQFFLYLQDGTRLVASGCQVRTAPDNSQVACANYGVGSATQAGGTPATNTQIQNAKLGTVRFGAVFGTGGAAADSNPEGSQPTVTV